LSNGGGVARLSANCPSSRAIRFPGGHTARALDVPPGTSAEDILRCLSLAPAPALLILNGGTTNSVNAAQLRVEELLYEGLARLAAQQGLAAVTGGTDVSLFASFAEGLAYWEKRAACIGVAVRPLVTWPGRPVTNAPSPANCEPAPLEPHHTHFALVEGNTWGDETPTMYALAAALSRARPSVAVFAGGGEITLREMLANAAQGRPMILLAGSGRVTDIVLGNIPPATPETQRLARLVEQTNVRNRSTIIPFDLSQSPDDLYELAQRILFPSRRDDHDHSSPIQDK
jgi:hypothetical protein